MKTYEVSEDSKTVRCLMCGATYPNPWRIIEFYDSRGVMHRCHSGSAFCPACGESHTDDCFASMEEIRRWADFCGLPQRRAEWETRR